MPTPYWPDRRQRDAELAARAAQERVGELDQDARAVALQRVGAGGAPMRQVFEDPEALGDDRVAFLALDVRDEAEAARVVLVRGVVHALARRRPRAQRPPTSCSDPSCTIVSSRETGLPARSRVPGCRGTRNPGAARSPHPQARRLLCECEAKPFNPTRLAAMRQGTRPQGGHPCNTRRQTAPGFPLKGLARTTLLRSNLKTIGYLVVAAFNSDAGTLRFQDNIIRNPPCPSFA